VLSLCKPVVHFFVALPIICRFTPVSRLLQLDERLFWLPRCQLPSTAPSPSQTWNKNLRMIHRSPRET
jgi:hypothetical protein